MLERREFLKFSPNSHAPSDGFWLHVSRQAMACLFEVTLPLWHRAGVRVARKALDEADRLEQQLTVFRESSEVSLINRHAAWRPVGVDPSLFALLLLCQELRCETEGAFDITSGPLSHCWGFSSRHGRIPDPWEIDEARATVGGDKLLLSRESRSVRFQRPGVKINLGSIGKGYALDCIAATIMNQVRTALLCAGGSSIRAIGGGDGDTKGWVVGVRHPGYTDRRLAVLRLRDCAMATSGSEHQFFECNGKRYGHIIDPRSGLPADRVHGVTVIAGSAAIADALATAFYVGGAELAERYCSTHPGILAVMLERGARHPVVFGGNDRCEVDMLSG